MKIKKILPLILTSLFISGCNTTTSDSSTGKTSGENQTSTEDISTNQSSSSDASGIIFLKEIYASPDGKSSNTGSKDSPLSLEAAMQRLDKGGKINLLEGTYKYFYPLSITRDYEKEHNVLATSLDEEKWIEPVKNETGDYVKVKIDFSAMGFASSNRGITLNSDYWHIKGFEVYGAGDNGVYIGGNHNTVELLDINNCQDTGLQLGRAGSSYETMDKWPSHNTILNCTSHDNHDPSGEDSDGFACKLTTGVGNVFDGCIAYNNVDDGWDLYTKGESGAIGPVTLKNCVAFNNGMTSQGIGTSNSDGNGFKLGGEQIAVPHTVINCVAFNNMATGFTDNSNPGTIHFENCTAYNNGTRDEDGYNFSTCRDTQTSINYYKNCLSYCDGDVINPITSESHIANSKDEYKGSASYCAFYNGLSNLVVGEPTKVDYSSSTYRGASYTYENPFVSVTSPQEMASKGVAASSISDVHGNLRNKDGSVNLGDFLKVKSTSPFYTMGENSTPLGAMFEAK